MEAYKKRENRERYREGGGICSACGKKIKAKKTKPLTYVTDRRAPRARWHPGCYETAVLE